MPSRVLKLRTLRRALEMVEGDERTLARQLHVPTLELHGFLMGEDSPPTPVFLAAVDIVTDGVTRRGASTPATLEFVEDQVDRAEEHVPGRFLGAG
jgi:hypothetical protein